MTSSANQAKQAESFLSGQLAAVDVAGIEKELKGLWKKAASPGSDAPAPATMIRACSFNLILFSSEANAETEGNDLLDDILNHHPARGILAIFRPEKPASLSAWVSARCHTSGSTKQICSEQITVASEGGHIRQLSSVVLPLVLPDLPVFLWWRHSVIDSESFKALHNCARRFILDSGRLDVELSLLKDAAALITGNRGCLWVSDLNWRRLTPWFEACADAFDGFPMPTDYLFKIKKISISHVETASSQLPAQPVLLCGWLASRLGWTIDSAALSAKQPSAKFKAKNNDVVLEFIPSASDKMPPGQILKVVWEFDDKRVLTAQIEQHGELSFIVAKEDNSSVTEATRIERDLTEAALVGQEVEELGSDRIYEGAMEMVAKLLKIQEKN